MEYIQFSAKTKNEAITKACIELGASSDQLDIQVVSEGSSGFFGIGSKPAIIKVRKIETVSEDIEIEKIVDSVKLGSIREDKKKEAPKPAAKPVSKPAPKAESVKETKEKQPKERPVKERQPKEKVHKERPVKEHKEKIEKAPKEKPVKVSKPVEIITDAEEIKEIENRAVVFLRDVFASM